MPAFTRRASGPFQQERLPTVRFDLTTLKLFLAVHEERSMAKAAEREHITAPAISKRIAELESALGVVLFERLSTGIRPTAAGDALALEAAGLFHNLDRMRGRLSEYASGQRGAVRIYSNPSGLVASLPDDLKTFMDAHRDVSVRVDEHHSDEVVRGVADGDADIGIFAHHIGAEDLTIVPYRSVQLVLVMRKDHPLAKRPSVGFAEAAAHEFVGLTRESAVGALLLSITSAQGIKVKSRIQVTGFEALRQMVHAGLGIGVIPESRALTAGGPAELVSVPLTDTWAQYRLNLCTRAPETLSMAARLMVEHLLAALARR
jgi:DNA-binding transcriptional LysR family regulator